MKLFRLLFLIFIIGNTLVIGQEIEQFQVFAGRFDYLAIGNTLNAAENGTGEPCVLLPQSSATLNLDPGQNVIAAYLYWAGSGDGDFDVTLNNTPITAERTFNNTVLSANPAIPPRTFFAAFADVTDMVIDAGAVEYTFGGVEDVDLSPLYCLTGTNFSGWSIVIVYEDMDLPLNQVNVFDGLESVSGSGVNTLSFTLNDLNVIDNDGAKIGFLAWEGDREIRVDETLRINGNLLGNPPLNPFRNQFNGTNTFTGSDQLFNMDIDVYDIQNNINIGDESALIELSSGQDLVLINSVVTVLNSQLPDAVISIDNVQTECNSRDITFDYIATNQGTDILPAGTPIAFYADEVLIGTSTIPTILDLGEFFEETITITIGQNIPDDFSLQAIVDDPDVVPENNEANNESNEISIILEELMVDELEDVFVCDDSSNDGIEIFNLQEVAENAISNQSDVSFEFYTSMVDAENQTNPILNPDSYQNTTDVETVFVRFSLTSSGNCVMIFTFDIGVFFQPTAPAIDPLQLCDDASNDGVEVFDLSTFESTILEPNVLAGQDPLDFSITFHNTQSGANTNTNGITPITEVSLSDEDSVFVRIENINNTSCFETTEIVFTVSAVPFANNVSNQVVCDDPSNDDVEDFDLTGLDAIVLGNQSSTDFTVTFHNSQDDADTNTGAITPITAVSQTNGSSLFARIENNDNSSCFDTTEIMFVVDTALFIEPIPDQVVCDDRSNDGTENFDLSTLEMVVIGLQNPEDFMTTFHNSEEDANANIGSITNITSVPLGNGDSVFARYQSDTFDSCFGITEINFVVNAAPIANTAPDQIFCDDLSNDGVVSFDLSIQNDTVIGEQTGMLLTYHVTLEDAETGENSIININDFENTTSPQMVYTRLENELNSSCFDIGFFDLVVLPIEDIITFDSMVECNDGFETAVFDLTSNPGLEGIPFDLITGFYTTLENAGGQIDPIVDPNAYLNTSSPQTVFVRIEGDDELECFEVGQITLEIEDCIPFIPEGFSPNSDGINDTFEITRLKNVFEDYKLYVYSRLGNLIYEGDNDIPFWDGVPNRGIGGTQAPTGVYYWVLEFNDPDISDQVGWVYLNREN